MCAIKPTDLENVPLGGLAKFSFLRLCDKGLKVMGVFSRFLFFVSFVKVLPSRTLASSQLGGETAELKFRGWRERRAKPQGGKDKRICNSTESIR